LKELPQLVDFLGNPPTGTEGLFFAIQAILYERDVLFFRVAEEGFSQLDYINGFRYLGQAVKQLHALCLPGVGDQEIINASLPLCSHHKSPLITSQKDLYDYLTG
jgi:hypothetical protein